MCAGPSRVGRRGCRPRKGHGDAPRAAPRLRWGAAAPAENSKQRNLTGGPGVPRTPGRRPPHRNGGTFGSFSHERTTIIRYVVKRMAAKPTQKPSNKATPAKANKEKTNARGAAGCGVPRKVTAPGKPASQFWQRERQGRARGCPQRPRRRKRKDHGDARCAPARQGWAGAAAASVTAMEMHQGRRPVYGGAPQHPPKIASNAISRGVQGSRGPLVGGRRIETAGRGA